MHVETIAAEAATEARADIVLSGRELRDAVKLLTHKAADKRSTVPTLASIHFEIAPDGRATLTATDLTAWASLTLQAVPGEIETAPGSFAIEGAALHKVLSKAGKAERIRLTVNTDATRVRLKTGRMEMHLRVTADEFPLAPITAFAAERAGEMSRAQFMADLGALAPAMSNEHGRDHLHGIVLQARDMAGRDSLVIAATDGFKLAAAARPIPAGCEAWADCILPNRTVDLALAAHKAAGAGDALIVSQGGRAVEIAFGNVSIYSQCVDATFPDWPRAFESIMAPTDAEQGALFPHLLPEYPAARVADMDKPAPGAIDWQPGKGALIGQCASDPGMVWAVMYLASDAGRKTAPEYDEGVTVEIEGDREYQIATTGKKLALTKEQVAALCGDSLWDVLEFPGADGRPRYVSQWLWDDGARRLLIVGADGRCPKADAPREYVTRAEVETALAGEIAAPVMIEAATPIAVASEAVSARQTPEDCAEAIPAPTDSAEALANDPDPLSCEPAADAPPITGERATRSDAERRAILRAWEMRAAMRRMRAEAVTAPDAVPAEIMADLAEAERLIRCEGYVAAAPTAIQAGKRTPAHERAIRRAWAERKARRMAKAGRDCIETTARTYAQSMERREQALRDQVKLAESIAEDHLRMREQVQAVLRATEARLAAAEAENAQLWGEIEGLTAPAPALAA
jgi:DNA polymerase III sliding clamp (beta) subunit (PCNA family)